MYGNGYDRGGYDRLGGYDRGVAAGYDRGGYDRGTGYDRGYGGPRPLNSNGGGGGNGGGSVGAGYPYEIPYRPQGLGYDNSPNAIGDSFGGFGPARPIHGGTRCDDSDSFKQMGVRQKVRRQYVRRVLPAQTLVHCQRECIDAKDFVCRSFNYRDTALSYDAADGLGPANREREREAANCELSDRDTRELDMQNPQMFDGGSFDYYERSNARSGSDGECLDGECSVFVCACTYYRSVHRRADTDYCFVVFSVANVQRGGHGVHAAHTGRLYRAHLHVRLLRSVLLPWQRRHGQYPAH